MNAFKSSLILILLMNQLIADAQQTKRAELPQERKLSVLNEQNQEAFNQSHQWDKFSAKGWKAVWDEVLGTPHRAWGKPFKIEGFESINNENVLEASHQFLKEYAEAFQISQEHLKVIRTLHRNKTWYVTFQQYYEDMPVIFSRVELRISDDAKVGLFGVDYFKDITIQEGEDLTREGFIQKQSLDWETENIDYFILPIIDNEKIIYKKVASNTKEQEHVSYYDSKTAELVWQKTKICNAFSGVATGLVQEELPTDPDTDLSFAHLYYEVNGERFTTGPNGEFEIDIQEPADLLVTMTGPFVSINNASQHNARIQKTIQPNEDVVIKWDDTNSAKAERNAFYHTNVAHDTLKAMDPSYTFLDYSLPVNVNRVPAGCNAFYNQVSINYDLEGGGCVSGADIAMVVYHEYGHAIIDKLFIEMGFSQGYISRPADEAQADVFATMIENSSVFAPGFFGPGTSTRNLRTFKSYPSGVDPSSPHTTGLILSGAFWDLKQRTSPELVNRLAHFAKYGAPDNIDVGTVFRDWFIEVLIADDDDDDLSNGTPHFEDIDWAFARHGINVRGVVNNGVLSASESDLDFIVFPNPATNSLEVNLNGIDEDYELEVKDLSGKTIERVKRQEIVGNRFYFDVSSIPPGILLVSVVSNRNIATKKVIIRSEKRQR